MSKYLVTGGAGFIGSHLVEYLEKQGHNIIIIDNFDELYSYDKSYKIKNLENIKAKVYNTDICNWKELNKVFKKEGSFHGIFHLAGKAGVRYSINDPQTYYNVNVLGSINLIQLAKEFCVPRFIFSSSSSVYGERKKFEPFSEKDLITKVLSPYAASKRSTEIFLSTIEDMKTLWCVRFFNVYGPRQRPDTVLHKFSLQILRGRSITKYGSGHSFRDYTYIDDLVKGLVHFMNIDKSYGIVNLGGGCPVSLNDLIYYLSLYYPFSSKEESLKILELPKQIGDVEFTYSDISYAKSLGWEPKVHFEEGIKNFLEWFRKTYKRERKK